MSGGGGEKLRLEQAYFRPARHIGYLEVAGNVAILALLLLLASVADAVWQYPLIFLLIGASQHRLFFPLHDSLHYSLFPTKAENRNVGIVLAGLLGTSFDAVRIQHLDHHRDFGRAIDPGADDYFVRFGSRRELVTFLLGPLVGSILIKKFGDYFLRPAAMSDTKKSSSKFNLAKTVIVYAPILLCQLLVCIIMTRGFELGALWRYPVLYALPLVTVFLFFIRLRMFLEHGSLDYEMCDYVGGRGSVTRTIYASRVERILLCGSNFNYHAEHHRYPAVPGCRLPTLHHYLATVERRDPHTVRLTYWQAFRELWTNLTVKPEGSYSRQQLP